MPQIAHINPGWFLLICGLVMLAVGFMLLLSQRNSSENTYAAPVMPLTQPAIFAPLPVYTALLNLPASPARAVLFASPPPPDELRIEPPVCYDSPNQNLMCLGRVFNFTADTVDSVRLRVEMNGGEATTIAQTEQRFIAPGGFAPYRVQFSHAFEEQASLVTRIESAHKRRARGYTLDVSDEQGMVQNDDGRYVVTATVMNPYEQAMRDVQVIGTVSDSQGQLTGYRVETLPGGISAGESRSLRLEITPQTLEAAYSHELTVLGWQE